MSRSEKAAVSLGGSGTPPPSAGELPPDLTDADAPYTSLSDAWGLPPLKERLAAKHGVPAENVLVSDGASLANYDSEVAQQRITKVVELGVMERLVGHLLTLSVPFFDRQSHSDIVQAVRIDVSSLRAVVVAMGRLLLEGCLAVGMVASAIWLSPSLAFWVLLVLPAAALPIVWIARRTLARSFTVRRTGDWQFLAWEAPNAKIPGGRLWISDDAGLRAFEP